jgi:hypothetical protein
MIQKLVGAIVALLRENMADVGPEKLDQHIVIGSISAQKPALQPMIALYPAKLAFSQNFKDRGGGRPRPQPAEQTIEIKSAKSRKQRKLKPTPMKGSTRGKLILEKDTVSESQRMLVEGQDFTIDYAKSTISFICDLKPPSQVSLYYSFAGVFTILEFQQEMLIDIHDTDMAAVEKWTSLTTGIILMNVGDLIETCNKKNEGRYQSNRIAAIPFIDRIQMIEGAPVYGEDLSKLQLKWRVAGHLKLVKEITDGFGLIEQVLSPGVPPEEGIRIQVE